MLFPSIIPGLAILLQEVTLIRRFDFILELLVYHSVVTTLLLDGITAVLQLTVYVAIAEAQLLGLHPKVGIQKLVLLSGVVVG